jgi:hypothetical protein
MLSAPQARLAVGTINAQIELANLLELTTFCCRLNLENNMNIVEETIKSGHALPIVEHQL